jgi:hypothetical protein
MRPMLAVPDDDQSDDNSRGKVQNVVVNSTAWFFGMRGVGGDLQEADNRLRMLQWMS